MIWRSSGEGSSVERTGQAVHTDRSPQGGIGHSGGTEAR
jgi:hypothetical protein